MVEGVGEEMARHTETNQQYETIQVFFNHASVDVSS